MYVRNELTSKQTDDLTSRSSKEIISISKDRRKLVTTKIWKKKRKTSWCRNLDTEMKRDYGPENVKSINP